MSKESFVRELTEARNTLYAALRGLSEEDLRLPAVDGYSIAELCGLISAWENRLLTLLQQISQGDEGRVRAANAAGIDGRFYANLLYDNVSFNRVQSRKRSRWPWREILNELIWTREETGWTVANMPEAVFFTQRSIATEDRGIIHVCPADIVRQMIAQDRQRAQEIQAWRLQEGAGIEN